MSHAFLSPSAASRWLNCTAAPWREAAIPGDGATEYAAWGTKAHAVAEACLQLLGTPRDFLGQTEVIDGYAIEVDDEMVECVEKYVDLITALSEGAVEVHIEKQLNLELVTTENHHGTADAIIVTPDEIIVADLKTGKGVKVDAEQNYQLMIYALAFINANMQHHGKRVRLMIVQPRLGHVSEWSPSHAELTEFAKRVWETSGVIFNKIDLKATPGEKQCQFCKAKATCAELAGEVANDFEAFPEESVCSAEPVDLSALYAKLPLYRMWIEAVEDEVVKRLMAGETVPGFKVVEGRKGARQWVDADAAEEALKALRLKQDEMYSKKLITPTQAEKLLGDNPKKWAKVAGLITIPAGKPTVVPESDKRPSLIKPVDDQFEVVADTVEDLL